MVAAAADSSVPAELTDTDRRQLADRLYTTRGRTELGVSLGVMPFDALIVTPNVQLLLLGHLTDHVGLAVQVGGGYGLPTGAVSRLAEAPYHGSPDDWRYLTSIIAGGEWAPIYAKMMVGGRVTHADLFLAKRFGATLQSSTLDGRLLVSPTFSPTVGTHVYIGDKTSLRAEFRYDLLVDAEPASLSLALGQNANVLVGLCVLTGKGSAPR
ncbi:MAG: hypothetical protein H6738_08850 [Alphaproteobacteria bacterium]|nr:hypothetical protein [Alphaproteobacteria bacterium]MCB9696869.1 hypothetical protein [Alphaproteobacteria bacterium]